jgi:hypothetical protein
MHPLGNLDLCLEPTRMLDPVPAGKDPNKMWSVEQAACRSDWSRYRQYWIVNAISPITYGDSWKYRFRSLADLPYATRSTVSAPGVLQRLVIDGNSPSSGDSFNLRRPDVGGVNYPY